MFKNHVMTYQKYQAIHLKIIGHLLNDKYVGHRTLSKA